MGSGRRRRVHDGETFLESVRSRLDRLEAMLMDLHWSTVGQWRQPGWEENSSEHMGFVSTSVASTTEMIHMSSVGADGELDGSKLQEDKKMTDIDHLKAKKLDQTQASEVADKELASSQVANVHIGLEGYWEQLPDTKTLAQDSIEQICATDSAAVPPGRIMLETCTSEHLPCVADPEWRCIRVANEGESACHNEGALLIAKHEEPPQMVASAATLEQRLGTVELAMSLKGTGKGLPPQEHLEARLWNLQAALKLKGAGKGKSIEFRLGLIEKTFSPTINSLD